MEVEKPTCMACGQPMLQALIDAGETLHPNCTTKELP